MAYLAFDELGAVQQDRDTSAAAAVINERTPQDDNGRLSPLEWAVVALARRDTLASLHEPGRLSAALGTLFGKKPNPRLADPRLEALRQMAVLSWRHRYMVPGSAVAAFLAAGFTLRQYETMLASIAAAGIDQARLA